MSERTFGDGGFLQFKGGDAFREFGSVCVCGDFRGVEDSELRQGGLLGGSWDLVTRAIIKVTTLITTYNPN